MKEKYKDKYRIDFIRLSYWHYGWDAAYFITICTKDRECYFGNVSEERMGLSPVGVLADVCWHEIKHHAKNVDLGAFVVMPNHIHGILILTGNQAYTEEDDSVHSFSKPPIGTQRFQNVGKNTISSIVGAYKSAVSRHARRLGYAFAWQTRFHDHIIRTPQSFERISDYIQNNPTHWEKDTFFTP